MKRHLDILTGALMLRQLQPWHANLGKRQVKSPKVYIRDTGLLHALLGVPSFRPLEGHPKLGASWEGFVIEEIIPLVGEHNAYFWATQSGAELDLLLLAGGARYGVEVKYGDAPGITKSMRIALDDLELRHLFVVYPGRDAYELDKRITALPLSKSRRDSSLGAARLGVRYDDYGWFGSAPRVREGVLTGLTLGLLASNFKGLPREDRSQVKIFS